MTQEKFLKYFKIFHKIKKFFEPDIARKILLFLTHHKNTQYQAFYQSRVYKIYL